MRTTDLEVGTVPGLAIGSGPDPAAGMGLLAEIMGEMF